MPKPVDNTGRNDIQRTQQTNTAAVNKPAPIRYSSASQMWAAFDNDVAQMHANFDNARKSLNNELGAATGNPAAIAEIQVKLQELNDAEHEAFVRLRDKHGVTDKGLAEHERDKQRAQDSRYNPSVMSTDETKEAASKAWNFIRDAWNGDGSNKNNGIAGSLANYLSSMKIGGKAPGSENLENQARMHDVQAAQEDANAQQNQQIANRDYRGEAEKNAVANAATQNAQTVANLGNASAGAAALERTVGTADYDTHMNRQDTQREKAVEKQREAWGARQTAEEERQAAAAENNDKRNMDMYNSLAKYLSQGAGGNGTDTSTTSEQTGGKQPTERTGGVTTTEIEKTEDTPPAGTQQQNTESTQQPTTSPAGTQQTDTESTQQPTTSPAGTQQTDTESIQQQNNVVPPMPAVNGVEPDKINVNAVTDEAGEPPLQNQVVTQGINDAIARKQAYENEDEFWNEYTKQIPQGGDNNRKQTHENFVTFQEDNPDEMSKPLDEQVTDFIKQDSDSYQNVDIDEILGASKGKYPPWIVAQAASIRNNAENGGDRQTADALNKQFNQLYYTYANKNSWYNKLSPQEQKRFNELYANATTQQQEAFLSALTDEQQKIYQSWMDGSLANRANLDNADILGNQDAYPQFLVDATKRYEGGKSAAHGLTGATGNNLNKLKDLYTGNWYQSLSDSDKAILNNLTNEQLDNIYFYPGKAQEYMQDILDDAHLKTYGSGKGSNYNTSPAVTDYDAAYKKVYGSNPSIRHVLDRLSVPQQQAYIDILNSSYDLSRDEDVKRAEGDLSQMSTGNVLKDLLSKDSQFNDRYNALKGELDKKYGAVQQTDMPAYKGDFSDVGGDEFNDIYASWKQYTPERQKLFDDMDKEGQEHWIRLRTGHATDADARYFAEKYDDKQLRDFHQFGFGDSMMAEIAKARQKLVDKNIESDARQKNIIAGCFSRF